MNKKQMHQIHRGLNKRMVETYREDESGGVENYCDKHQRELEVYIEEEYDGESMTTWAKVAPCPECLEINK